MTTFNPIRLGGPKAGEQLRGCTPLISFHLQPEMKRALAAYAERNGMNRSAAMRMLIETGLEAERKKVA
jgi:Ribbon-helix-helix protein, copG family